MNEIECDVRTTGVCVNDVGDRVKWRLRTKEQIAVIETREKKKKKKKV